MTARFVCACGMAFSVESVRPNQPVVCPACGAVQEHEAEPVGGRPAPAAAPPADPGRPTVRCPDCGALNSAEDALCGLCGTRLDLQTLLLTGETAAPPAEADPAADFDSVLATDETVREPIRYEGALRVPMIRLVLRLLVRPRREMETLVSFLSYRDMVWKLLLLFAVGVVGLWAAAWRFSAHPLPIVSGFTFGARMPPRATWSAWLGMAFSAAAFITVGLTLLAAAAGLLTGHGWRLSPLALSFMFVVSLVNAAHLLLLPAALLGPTAVTVLAWALLAWQALLTIFVINKVLDCDAVLSVIIALLVCALTVHFYNRVYRVTERILPGEERVTPRYERRAVHARGNDMDAGSRCRSAAARIHTSRSFAVTTSSFSSSWRPSFSSWPPSSWPPSSWASSSLLSSS